ncbi:hypothetical protein M9458_057845 [Cirrhinus mrigala]|uniref:Uncharacterized protein n=1 Tax=Cirrhinus mrigala TaxID=683832 RepID=A0ABD0MDR2_CIRMR
MSAKDRQKKVSFDHDYSSAATDSPSTDSSSGDLPIILPPAPDTPLSGPMPKRNKGSQNILKITCTLRFRILKMTKPSLLRSFRNNKNRVKVKVLEICNVLAPESCQKGFDVIDIAHWLGKPQPGRIRAVIILFTLRSVRDAVWRNAKNNEFLKQRKLRFVEDLTKEEKDRRSLLWQESA